MNISDGTIKSRLLELFPSGMAGNDTIDVEKQLQPSTLDLRLGNVFYTMKTSGTSAAVLPTHTDPEEYFDRTVVDTQFLIQPGTFVLAQTMECVRVPDDLVGFVDGRSSYGRWGLRVHSTAGLIDAGFCGVITLEMATDIPYPLALIPGERVCQIRFEQLDRAAERPYGHHSRKSKYQHQHHTTLSRAAKDGAAQ